MTEIKSRLPIQPPENNPFEPPRHEIVQQDGDIDEIILGTLSRVVISIFPRILLAELMLMGSLGILYSNRPKTDTLTPEQHCLLKCAIEVATQCRKIVDGRGTLPSEFQSCVNEVFSQVCIEECEEQ